MAVLVLQLGGGQNAVFQPPIEKLGVNHIHPTAAKHLRKLFLDVHDLPPRGMPRLELYEQIDVAIGTEVSAKRGAKQP